ncbi:MAG: sulfatase [Gemmataceae bacterium]
MSPLSLVRFIKRSVNWTVRHLWRPLAPASPHYGELVSLAFAVCTVLFLTKGLIAYRDLDKPDMPPQIVNEEFLWSLGRLWVCCAEDFAVGIGCLLLALVTIKLRDSLWYRRTVRFILHVAAGLAICYMIVNAQIYHVIHRFLTVSLFEFGGGLKPERSIYEGATLTVKLAVGMLPLLVIALHMALATRLSRFWNRLTCLGCRPLVLLLLVGGLTAASQAGQVGMFPGRNKDFAQNPHLLLARSFFGNVSFGDLDDQTGDLTDFQTGDPRHGCRLEQRPKNIILIVVESAAAQYLQTYGFPLPTTPGLEKLKGKSLIFDNFYATANHTIASALPLFGSTYNDPHTVATLIDYPAFPVPLAQTWLKSQGYKTCFLASGGWRTWEGYRNMAPSFLGEGFDVARDPHHPFWRSFKNPEHFLDRDYLDPEMFDDAKRLIRESKDQKFFLLMWNYSTHHPYYADKQSPFDVRLYPPAFLQGATVRQDFHDFLVTILQTDALICSLYQELEGQGLGDDTLVVVTGDHGEAFGQHGAFIHGDSVYEEEVRVPLVLINPRLPGIGTRNKTVGSHIDVWPTITDICGLPAHPLWQGKSLLGDWPDAERRAYFCGRGGGGTLGIRAGKYKYLWDYGSQTEQLFDIETDPGETTNLADEHQDLCHNLRRRLRDWTNSQTELTKERLADRAR